MPTQKTVTRTEIPKTPFRFFWYVTKPFWKSALLAVFLVIAGASILQGSSYFFKLIVDAVEVGDYDAAFTAALWYPVVVFIGDMSFRASAAFGGRPWSVGAERYSYDRLTEYLLKHSHSYFTNRFAGALMSKMNNITGAIASLIPELLWSHLSSVVSLLVTAAFLFMVDPVSGGIFVFLFVLLILINRNMADEKAVRSRVAAETATTLRARIVDVITNVQAVRQYVHTGREEKRIQELSRQHGEANNRSWGYTEKMLLINSVILLVFSLLLFFSLISKWQAGIVSSGEVVLVIALYSQIMGTLIFIGRAFNATARTVGEMQEGLEELLVPYEIVNKGGAKRLKANQASISWKEVGFKFQANKVFDNFNLHIPPSQRLGLVGQSGAGKTTFVSLLLRQHDISAGSIEIDGQNIAAVTQDSLRQNIAVVPQEPALFHRSIRENILYGNPHATEAEVIEVAKKAQAHDFISELPEGYDTLVGERGVKLSGGQKQRVAIARAMLKDAPILVLDEATSALDSESEVAIQKALENLMEGRTVIAVAHRLSTLRKMDRIIVMENGQIIEDGTHESLAQAGGVYERLWNHQAGGFLKE